MPPDELTVSQYRAVMTTTDRERIAGETEIEDSKRYQAISRVRSRIEELETDVKILDEHHPELLQELREAVCEQ